MHSLIALAVVTSPLWIQLLINGVTWLRGRIR